MQNVKLQLSPLFKGASGFQDGAIYNGKIFRLNGKGFCQVMSLENFEVLDEFTLNNLDKQVPHSNAVCMGDFCGKTLLYTNLYNNYKGDLTSERRGVVCVYELNFDGKKHSADLIQTIKIGFADERGLWQSKSVDDVRPYGNFVVDFENKRLYAFTMVDQDRVTRFFEFDLPDISQKEVVLTEQDVVSIFDSAYSRYLQGACFNKNYILSVEGMTNNPELPPYLRIIDVKNKTAILEKDLTEYGINIEPEFIEAYNGEIYYADYEGNFYKIEIQKV